MDISEREQRALFSVSLNSKKTAKQVGREIGCAEHTARRILSGLYERKIASSYTFLNVYKLGFAHYGVFFSLGSGGHSAHEALVSYLIRHERIAFVVELGGDYQIGISICARSLDEVTEFLDEVSGRFGNAFFEKSIAIRTRLDNYQLKTMKRGKTPLSSLSWGLPTSRVEIDELDHRILSALSNGSHGSNAELARAVRSSPMTIDYRLRNLRKSGVIVGDVTVVDTDAIGLQSYYLLLYTRGLHATLKKDLSAFCAGHPNIFFLVENLGSWDYELGVQTENPRDIVRITQEIHQRFGDQISTTKALPVFAYRKVSNYPFVTQPRI